MVASIISFVFFFVAGFMCLLFLGRAEWKTCSRIRFPELQSFSTDQPQEWSSKARMRGFLQGVRSTCDRRRVNIEWENTRLSLKSLKSGVAYSGKEPNYWRFSPIAKNATRHNSPSLERPSATEPVDRLFGAPLSYNLKSRFLIFGKNQKII